MKLELTSPVLAVGNVVELSFSTQMAQTSTVQSWDTALCTIPFFGAARTGNYVWEAHDVYAGLPLVELTQ